jgi:hypothetical protein
MMRSKSKNKLYQSLEKMAGFSGSKKKRCSESSDKENMPNSTLKASKT